MIVNNFKKIKKFIEFHPQKKTVVWVWVAIRAKDNDEHIERTVKSYHIQSMEDFEKRQPEIIKLCREFHCRAYICVNPKPILNILFSLQSVVMQNIKNEVNGGSSMLLKGMLDSAIMKSGGDGDNKYWVIDVDTQDEDLINLAYNAIDNAGSGFDKNIVMKLPTAHGVHFITHPFDTRVLMHLDAPADLKKEGLTLLYACLKK